MSSPVSVYDDPEWRFGFSSRYLPHDQFLKFCDAVGLRGCTEEELESYERERLMFPAARVVKPDELARAYHTAPLDGHFEVVVSDEDQPLFDLVQALMRPLMPPQDGKNCDWRHPIDRSWGRVPGLVRPADQDYLPWKCYTIEIDRGSHKYHPPTATHYYHYWQVYHLYYLRRFRQGMYRDNTPILPHRQLADGNTEALLPILDAASYFQHMYQPRLHHLTEALGPDDDGRVWYDGVGQQELQQAARRFAMETLDLCRLDEDILYEGLKGMMHLHQDYRRVERVRLAETLRQDIWRLVELIAYACGSETEDIARRAGPVHPYFEDYLGILFPNRRREARDKTIKILESLASEHNQRAPAFAMSPQDIAKMLDFIETSDLSIFEYMLVQLNEAHFATHSWQEAEAFLALKSLATFPESLVKTLIRGSHEMNAPYELERIEHPSLGSLNRILLQRLPAKIGQEYYSAGHREAPSVEEFRAGLGHLTSLIALSPSEEAFLGASLSLATLVRNFTAHFVVNAPRLVQGQYLRCTRAILSATSLAWHVARMQGWV